MAKERTPAKPKKSTRKSVVHAWRKSRREAGTDFLSLKTFARIKASKGVDEAGDLSERCSTWLFNKSANFSKPPQGIGSTRKKKTVQGGKKSS